MFRLFSAAAVFLGLATTAASAVTLTVYTDPDAFATALDRPLVTEDFETAPIASIELEDGEIAMLGVLGFTYEGELDVNQNDPFPGGDGEPRILPDGVIDGSQEFVGEINADGTPSGVHILITPEDVLAFGGDFYNALTGASLTISILDYEVVLSDYLSGEGTGFLGIISDTPFNMVYFDTEFDEGSEVFRLDNVVFAPVPLPAAALMLLSGIGALAFGRRIKGRRSV